MGLAAGEEATGGCTRTTNSDPGQAPTTLTVDAYEEVDETDDEDNVLSVTIYISE